MIYRHKKGRHQIWATSLMGSTSTSVSTTGMTTATNCSINFPIPTNEDEIKNQMSNNALNCVYNGLEGSYHFNGDIVIDDLGSYEFIEKKQETQFVSYEPHKKKVAVETIIRPCVYLLYHVDRVVYVGQSINFYQRLTQHKDKAFTHYRVLHCRKDRMNYWEKKLIQHFYPVYNKSHKT